ncbi:hypothetical protein BpHYR1_033947 [Brachionus plicatilis]|uniref:Uncharacterized protein n=1 Tax=Brachionus plicatilis TaxID=10195 RepID=A0A3M7S0Z1_BRAPC|nr:hypothetical protein BpHYR1_033947 [Brachionus plicatilis]
MRLMFIFPVMHYLIFMIQRHDSSLILETYVSLHVAGTGPFGFAIVFFGPAVVLFVLALVAGTGPFGFAIVFFGPAVVLFVLAFVSGTGPFRFAIVFLGPEIALFGHEIVTGAGPFDYFCLCFSIFLAHKQHFVSLHGAGHVLFNSLLHYLHLKQIIHLVFLSYHHLEKCLRKIFGPKSQFYYEAACCTWRKCLRMEGHREVCTILSVIRLFLSILKAKQREKVKVIEDIPLRKIDTLLDTNRNKCWKEMSRYSFVNLFIERNQTTHQGDID